VAWQQWAASTIVKQGSCTKDGQAASCTINRVHRLNDAAVDLTLHESTDTLRAASSNILLLAAYFGVRACAPFACCFA